MDAKDPPFTQVGVELPMDSDEADEENKADNGKTLLYVFGRGCESRHLFPLALLHFASSLQFPFKPAYKDMKSSINQSHLKFGLNFQTEVEMRISLKSKSVHSVPFIIRNCCLKQGLYRRQRHNGRCSLVWLVWGQRRLHCQEPLLGGGHQN